MKVKEPPWFFITFLLRLIEIKEKCEIHAKQEEKLTEELAKESEFRQKVESEWNERAEQHRNEVEQLNSQLQKTETVFEQLRLSYQTLYQSTQKDLKALSSDREKIVREIKRLQDENDNLTGKYSSKGTLVNYLIQFMDLGNSILNDFRINYI